jgi:hypothetical protein
MMRSTPSTRARTIAALAACVVAAASLAQGCGGGGGPGDGCEVDADCDDGFRCMPVHSPQGPSCVVTSFICDKPCESNADCDFVEKGACGTDCSGEHLCAQRP